MREIKFRAWDGRRMLEVQKMLWAMDGDLFAYESGSDKLQTMPLMQFTGLKDKNGVEIYEEDIIYYVTRQTNHSGVVTYGKGAAYVWQYGSLNFHMWDMDCAQMEVVGNKYENPELVK